MRCLSNTPIGACLLIGLFAMALASPCRAVAQATPPASPSDASIAKAVGTIKSLQADSIMIASESGGDVTATLTGSPKILRVPPGEKDLKNATTLQVQDLQPGDRVLIRGQSSGDPHTR